MGPGADTRSGGAQGKFECMHSPLGFLEVPFVHPEMSRPCFPGWGPPCNVTSLLPGMGSTLQRHVLAFWDGVPFAPSL